MKTNNIFIHAISPRCGHNFLTKLIQSQIGHSVIIHESHEVIVPELLADKIDQLENNKRFIRNKKAKIKEIEIAANNYISNKDGLIFKSSTLTSRYEIDLFPDVKHIILVRNPKDLFVSYEKSLYRFRENTFKNKIKKLCRPFYTYYVLVKWSKQLQQSILIIKSAKTKFLLIKYEELLKVEGQKKVFNFLDKSVNQDKAIKIDNLNSSFAGDGEQWKKASKNVGDTTKRFEISAFWLKWMINSTMSKTCKLLNYNLDNEV